MTISQWCRLGVGIGILSLVHYIISSIVIYNAFIFFTTHYDWLELSGEANVVLPDIVYQLFKNGFMFQSLLIIVLVFYFWYKFFVLFCASKEIRFLGVKIL